MLPLLDRDLPARRIDLFQPSVNASHPLAAIEIANDSGSGLPPGVLTLYQQNPDSGALYLGDARLAALPAGDKRLLSYALDSKVTIDRDTAERRPIVKASVADGVMRIGRVAALDDDVPDEIGRPAAPVAVDRAAAARRRGLDLARPEDRRTDARRPIASRRTCRRTASGSLTVVEEQPIEETIRLLDIDDNRLGVLLSSAELDPKMKQALAELASRRREIARQQGRTRPAPGAARPADRGRKPAARQSGRCRERAGAAPAASSKNSPRPRARSREFPARVAAASDALAAAERDLAAYVNSLTL